MHAHEMCSHIIQILIPETALSIYWRLGNHIQQQKVVLSIKPRCRFCGLFYSKSSIVYAHIFDFHCIFTIYFKTQRLQVAGFRGGICNPSYWGAGVLRMV